MVRWDRGGAKVIVVSVSLIVVVALAEFAAISLLEQSAPKTVLPYIEPLNPPIPSRPAEPEDLPLWDVPLPAEERWGRPIHRRWGGGEEPVPSEQTGNDCGAMSMLGSREELLNRIAGSLPTYDPWRYVSFGSTFLLGDGSASGATVSSYSSTNLQVEGVDEPDIAKTDGRFLYTISNGSVVILRAWPAESVAVVSRITPGGGVHGLHVTGDRLVVLSSASAYTSWYGSTYHKPPTRILVYDVADRSAPNLLRTVEVSGSYVDSRRIGDYVYLIADHLLYWSGETLVLPSIRVDGTVRTLSLSDIGYFDDTRDAREVTLLLSVNVRLPESPRYAALLTRPASDVYVSLQNVYLAAAEAWYSRSATETSVIHKLTVFNGDIRYVCSGRVSGTILNQFSMDEHGEYLRVATTVGSVAPGGGTARNNLYVLGAKMESVGALEGLAPGERIYSARFLGSRAYLVTFKKVDPLFVLDLSDPRAPKVVGYLKVPGFSDYMHPLDVDHVLGLGKETVQAEGGDFAWFQGLKLSLFEATEVEKPAELAKLVIGDRGTTSEAMRNHHAFQYFASFGLAVFPVDLALINETRYPTGVPPWAFGDPVWQGVVVVSVSLETGLGIRGWVTHIDSPSRSESYSYTRSPLAIRRVLRVEDYLYTVSGAMVEAHALPNLLEVARVKL